MMKYFLPLFVVLSASFSQAAERIPTAKVDFKRDIQPVFRRHCYRCHGPKKARARLQLTNREEALAHQDPDEPLLVPGQPEKSLLLLRLTDEAHGDIMPLDSPRLSTKQISRIRQWIKEGANWPASKTTDKHWAYIKPHRPTLPSVETPQWAQNAIDRFILAKMENEGLTPSPRSEKARLLRRVSLALTGLPPTLKDVEDFLNDTSPNAYEKVVDRLLQSKQYGEHQAHHWLDLARYADSNGFQADQLRDSWAYRDQIIRAFNSDMPFDQFVIEQLAGDLLPKPTLAQKIMTGFHRTVTCNVEAGVHPEANRVNQIFDRINTTGIVFLGTSLECSQCHDHKYDPFTQKEYYQLFACFNNTPLEVKLNSGVQFEFFGPAMDLPMTKEQTEQRNKLQSQLKTVQAHHQKMQKKQLEDFAKWEKEVSSALQINPAVWGVLPVSDFSSTGGEEFKMLNDGSVLLGGSLPGTAIYSLKFQGPLQDVIGFKVEALTHESLPGKGPGRGDAKRSNFILSEFTAEVTRGDDPKGERRENIEFDSAQADFSQNRWEVAKAIDGDRKTGWAIGPQFRKPHWASFFTETPLSLNADDTLVIKIDQNYGRGRTIGRVRISALIGDSRTVALSPEARNLLKKSTKRTKKENRRLMAIFSESNPKLQQLTRQMQQLQRRLGQIKPPTTLVMKEMEKPRETHILKRGDYLNKGEKVTFDTPSVLHPLNDSLPKNRLGFAKWLTSRDNPLLARVTVNRWWARLFGQGIVTTPEDFGTQGEPPTHPQLLDWLAVELMDKKWSVKHIHKQIVMSATFQQSARLTPELNEKDPQNKLYARGPRFRLSAETIRDNALKISGLLSTKMYGEPIMPYQPSGIWKAVGRNQPKWVTATNENRFRRGLYVVWKRGAPYPAFVNFDAPDRAACTVDRPRTNTPLQALTLLNDPAYAEMAMALAQRIMTENDGSLAEKVSYGFRLTLSRKPSQREVAILLRLYQAEYDKMKADPKLAQQRLQNLLPRLRDKELDTMQLASWFAVANVLLNLDETISQ